MGAIDSLFVPITANVHHAYPRVLPMTKLKFTEDEGAVRSDTDPEVDATRSLHVAVRLRPDNKVTPAGTANVKVDVCPTWPTTGDEDEYGVALVSNVTC